MPASTPKTVVSVVLFIVMAVFWIVLLAGTGAAHRACVQSNKQQTTQALPQPQKGIENKNNNDADGGDLPVFVPGRKLMSHGRVLMGLADDVCSNQMSLPWWVVWFEAICIVFGILVVGIPFMSRFSTTAVAFFIMCTTIMMFTASVANDQIFNYKDSQYDNVKKYVAGTRCALAGMICLMIANFIYIIISTDAACDTTPQLGCGSTKQPSPPSSTPVTELPPHKAAPATPTKPGLVTPTTPPYVHPEASACPATVSSPTTSSFSNDMPACGHTTTITPSPFAAQQVQQVE